VTNQKTFTKRIGADYIRGMFAIAELRNSCLSESSLAKLCLSVEARNKLTLLENVVLRGLSGPKRKVIRGGGRKAQGGTL
jgi:hypothetical protein